MRRLSPLESTYTKDRATEICLATLTELGFDLAAATNIKLDLDDRPQKAPRACVIASDPPSVVHLITRAQGGLHDYQAFLHEAGHALHYGGVDADPAVHLPPHLARPRADRDLLVHRRGDLARAGLARAVLRPLRRAGRRERRRDGLPRGAALPPLRGEAPLRARLLVALPRRRRHARGLRGVPHRGDGHPLPLRRLPVRHGRGLLLGRLPARVDPLGAAAPPPDQTVGEDWWRNPATGELLRELFAEGTKPSSEEIAARHRLRPARHGPAARTRSARSLRLHCRGHDAAHSSSGLGHRPLTAAARVRIPYGP